MKGNNKFKIACIFLSSVTVILIVFLAAALWRIKKLSPVRYGLSGYFQENITEGQNAPRYRANFDPHTNTYYIESVFNEGDRISQGKWEKYNDTTYLLSDDKTKDVVLVVLQHDMFYYRHPQNGELIQFVTDGIGQSVYFKSYRTSEEKP